jgi:hypothetical protein
LSPRQDIPGLTCTSWNLKALVPVLERHLPLDAAADVIERLTLTSGQISRANRSMQRIVRQAWIRQRVANRRVPYEEFADGVAARDWALLFEVCALLEVGHHHEATALITSAHARSASGDQGQAHGTPR